MKTTRLNEDIDRDVRGVCDIRPEWSKCNFAFQFLLEHLAGRIDGFDELVRLLNNQTNRKGLNLTDKLNFNFRFGHERHVIFYYFAQTKTAKKQQQNS